MVFSRGEPYLQTTSHLKTAASLLAYLVRKLQATFYDLHCSSQTYFPAQRSSFGVLNSGYAVQIPRISYEQSVDGEANIVRKLCLSQLVCSLITPGHCNIATK